MADNRERGTRSTPAGKRTRESSAEGESDAPSRLIPDGSELPAKKTEQLSDYVGFLPLAILTIVGGAWLKVHAKGAVELGGSVIAAIGTAGFLLRFLPDGALKRSMIAFGRWLASPAVARIAWGSVAVAGLGMLSFSSIQVSAKDDLTPITVFRMNGEPDGASDLGGQIELTRGKPSNSFLVPIGRRQWLRTSTEDRTKAFRPVPLLPQRFTYPNDFPSPLTVVLLPTGSFFGDLGTPLRLVVVADDGRGDTLAVDSVVRIEALVLSVGSSLKIDTVAMRTRWSTALQKRVPTSPSDIQAQVSDWMRARGVRTTRALKNGERIAIVLLSAARDTLAAEHLTLATPVSDVILIRRTN